VIVTRISAGAQLIGADNTIVFHRCIARRGMLYSECEAIDYVRLPARTTFRLRGRSGVESAWLALAGTGSVPAAGPLAPGDVLLAPDDGAVIIEAGQDDLELLYVRVLPRAVSVGLPARRPEL
jgi:hypothetical protein